MKHFLRKSIIFILFPIALTFAIELIVPTTWFTFRAWEATITRSGFFLGPFFPNLELKMTAVGDLAHHTKFAVLKDVVWKTDELGFRNDHFVSKPDVLIIGDSNIAGSALSQGELLSSLLSNYTGLTVYNLAPADINTFIALKNEGIMKSPKVLILGSVERHLTDLSILRSDAKVSWPEMRRNSLMQWGVAQLEKLLRVSPYRFLKSRLRRNIGLGVQSTIDERMFFLEGNGVIPERTDSELESAVDRIVTYQEYCQSIGSDFILLPIPNKETTHWEVLGLKQSPTLIYQLNQRLRSEGIRSIESAAMFKQLNDANILPFHLDDTHWNKQGVDLVAKEIAQILVSKDS